MPITPRNLALDTPVTPDISRARSMQPVSTFCQDRHPKPETQPETEATTKETAKEVTKEVPDVVEDELPATQPFHKEDGEPAQSGQPSSQMDTEMG